MNLQVFKVMPLVAAVAFTTDALGQRQISDTLEETVVTAQKREENLQDVAISVSAMDAAAIEKTFSRTLDEITGMSPNLVFNPILGNGTVGVSIRGMQHAEVEKSFDPSVAIYQDGIYLKSTTGALLNLWDAERIEVLRGPQGTLFGRNTIGGLIHVIRSKPTGEFGGKIVATIAEDHQEDIKALINLPSMGGLSVKLSAMNIQGGGYFHNIRRNKREGDNDMTALSISALWEPSDNFDINFIYDDIDDDTETRPVTCLTNLGEQLGAASNILGMDLLPKADPADYDCSDKLDIAHHYKSRTGAEQPASMDTEAITIHANWQITDAHKLAFVFGDRDVDETVIQEFDGTELDLFKTSRPTNEQQTSFEFRLESDWDWGTSTFGAFFWESEYTMSQNTNFFKAFGTFGPQSYTASPWYHQETENTAYFGQVDIDVTENLSVSLGGRYIDEEKEACMVVSDNDQTGGTIGTWVGPDGVGKTPNATFGVGCPSFGLTPDPTYNDGRESWDKFTPRVGLTYSGENGMVYLTYSEGFRSGGYNGRASAPGNIGPYDPESVEAWELGFKSSWMDNRVTLNGSIFDVSYDDKQEDIVKPGEDGQATLTVVENAATASISGVELELAWMIASGLSLRGNIGLLDASFDEYLVDSATGPVDKSGIELRRAPDMTMGLGLLWEHELANGAFLVANMSYTWKDDYYISASTSITKPNYGEGIAAASCGGCDSYNPSKVDAFGLLDASINYETENWTVSIFGKNLTDENYFMSFLDVGGNVVAAGPGDTTAVYAPGLWSFGTLNRPRYFGAEVKYKF